MKYRRRLVSLLSVGAMALAFAGMTVAEVHAQPNGRVGVDVSDDTIHGSGFGPNATLTIQRGAETRSWTNGVSGPWDYDAQYDNFTLYLQGTWDVLPGDAVTVTGNDITDTMTIADVQVTSWDFAANTISGAVDPSSNDYPVYLSVGHYGQQDPSTLVVQRTAGVAAWTGDMDDVDTNAGPPISIRVNDSVQACQPDAAGNESCSSTVLAGPRFTFGIETQEIVGVGWPNGVDVSLTIDRPSTVTSPDYTAAMTPPTSDPYAGFLQTGSQGLVYFDLTNAYPAQPGDLITMSNGDVSKTLYVPMLTTNLPDLTNGQLTGTASAVPAGGFLTASSGFYSWGGGARQDVERTASGAWTADFGAGQIDPSQNGSPVAYMTDPDGDTAESISPAPALYVDPTADRIWGIDFAPGNTTVTVQRRHTVVYTHTVATANVLTKGSWNIDMWAAPTGTLQRPAVVRADLAGTLDIRAGDIVTVSDSVSTRSIRVASLTIDRISADPINTIVGQATEPVTIHFGDGEGGYWGYQTTPVRGQWGMFFDKTQFPNPTNGLQVGDKMQAIINVAGGGTVVRVTVQATMAMPNDLVPVVQSLALSSRVERILLASLTAAQRAYAAGRIDAGARAMNDFIATIQSLTPTPISQHMSDVLVADANLVIDAHA